MSNFQQIPERLVELAEKLGQQVKHAIPEHPENLLKTGVALGALRTGARTASRFARRNPVLTAGVAVGAGLLYLAARHRAKQQAEAAIEGKSVRVDARRDGRVRPGDDAGDYFE